MHINRYTTTENNDKNINNILYNYKSDILDNININLYEKYKINNESDIYEQIEKLRIIYYIKSNTANKYPGYKNSFGKIISKNDIIETKKEMENINNIINELTKIAKNKNKNFKTEKEKNIEKIINNDNSEGIKFLYEHGYNKTDNMERLYNNMKEKNIQTKFNDGSTGLYKLHITPSKIDFDNILKEMGIFLNGLGVLAKIPLGDHNEFTNPNNKQFGKAMTIYTSDKDDMIKIMDKVKSISKKYNGVYPGTNNLLKYEYPIKGTNNLLHYSIEKYNNNYIPYEKRKEIFDKYRGEGPLDRFC